MKLLVVNFHYFREEKYSSGIYPISRAALDKQIDALAKYHTFISQSELLEIFKSKNFPEGTFCLLTIDDGLKEQMEAFMFLATKGIVPVLYVPTFPIQNRKVLDVHKLHFVRTQLKDQDIFEILDEKFRISAFQFDNDVLANQYRYDSEISRKVKFFMNFVLDNQQKEDSINSLFSQLIADEKSFADQLYLSEDDLKLLANADALGSHGHRHIPLATLLTPEAKEDILTSIKYLEELTGKPVQSFSYPYGGREAVNENLSPVFINTNVKFALTMWRGINDLQDISNPLFLKRIDTNDAPGGKNNSLEYISHISYA